MSSTIGQITTTSRSGIAHHDRAPSSLRTPKPRFGRARSVFARPGVVELTVLALLFAVYNVVRALPTTRPRVAVEHAHQLLSLEGPFFGWIEVPLNHWLLAV